MSNIFSIDDSLELIKNSYIKELFEEVHSSYVIGNYRSAVVMLWSVVVTDLLLKLKDLDAIYNDDKANKILIEITSYQKDNPTSSKWESDLVENFFKEFNFFGTPELEQLRHLQKMRHVCAHPVIGEDDLLYMPSKAKVYSLIEVTMKSIFLKDALISGKAISHIFKELNRVRTIINGEKERQLYFKNKLLPLMTDNVIKKFISTLWTFIFVKTDENIELNLEINASILSFLVNEKKDLFLEFLKSESKSIAKVPTDEIFLDNYMEFWVVHKEMFYCMDNDFQKLIISIVENPAYKYLSCLKFKNMSDFLCSFKKGEFKDVDITYMSLYEQLCEEEFLREKYNNFCINILLEIVESTKRDDFYRTIILPSIDKFHVTDLKNIIEGLSSKKLKLHSSKSLIDNILKRDINFSFEDFVFFNKIYLKDIKHSIDKYQKATELDLPF